MTDAAEALTVQNGVSGVSTWDNARMARPGDHAFVRHHFSAMEASVRAVLAVRAVRIEIDRVRPFVPIDGRTARAG